MSIDHDIWWWIGRDPREPSWRGIFLRGSWDMAGSNPLNTASAPGNGWSGPVSVPRCSDPNNPPITVDDAGQPFPPDSVFIPGPNQLAAWCPGSGLRNNNADNPLVVTSAILSEGLNDLVYVAIGITPGSSLLQLQIQGNNTSTIYYALPASVLMDGTTYYLELPQFSVSADDTSCTITTQWTTVPHGEGIAQPPGCSANFAAGYIVPTTLPAGYTLRLDTDLDYGAGYANCGGNGYRLRSGPNSTYEFMGGAGPTAIGGLLWIAGVPYAYDYLPIAQGPAVLQAFATFVAGVGPTDTGTIGPTPGCRAMQISFQYEKLAADPQPTDTFTWQVTQDGTPVTSGSAMGSAIKSIPNASVPVTLPAVGTDTTFVLTVNGSSSAPFPPPAWTVTATLSGSPRCDIPLPYTVEGPGTAIPGGYYPGALSTPTNSQPLTRAAPGVTSVALGVSAGNVAFLPVAAGWYKVLISGSAQPYVGESPFGWQEVWTCQRGHPNQPFYARADAGGTLVLTPSSPPAPTACASGGTAITQDAATYGAFASVALPSAGTWKIKVNGGEAIGTGLVVETSLSDPLFLSQTTRQVWEGRGMTPFGTSGAFSGLMLNTPPVYGGGVPFQWVVGPSPTGAWVGHTNDVATWDVLNNGWAFNTPVNGSIMVGPTSIWWFDGSAWHSNGTDPQITIPITTTGPQTVYLLVSPISTVLAIGTSEPGAITISWAAA